MTNMFNNYYANVGKNLANKISKPVKEKKFNISFSDKPGRNKRNYNEFKTK